MDPQTRTTPNQAKPSQRKPKNGEVELAATLQVSRFFGGGLIFHAQNLKQSKNLDFEIDMAWEVLKFMIFFVDPYSVLASSFQHLSANIAVESPKCETVVTFGVTFATLSKILTANSFHEISFF